MHGRFGSWLRGCGVGVRGLGVAALLALTPAASGCTVNAGPGPVATTGFITVQWTIAGTFSPQACADFGVYDVELVALDLNGAVVSTQDVACEAQSAQLELYPGTYTVDVTMLDANLSPRSTTLHLPPTDVYSGSDVVLDTDFPPSSFY